MRVVAVKSHACGERTRDTAARLDNQQRVVLGAMRYLSGHCRPKLSVGHRAPDAALEALGAHIVHHERPILRTREREPDAPLAVFGDDIDVGQATGVAGIPVPDGTREAWIVRSQPSPYAKPLHQNIRSNSL